MDSPLNENPTPDFAELERLVRGGVSDRVNMLELLMDAEMM